MSTGNPQIEHHKLRRLFIVCPFSQLEYFLSSKFGDRSYFLTAPGSVLFLNQISLIESIEDFLRREDIQEIAVVNEWSSIFIRNALNEEYEPIIDTASVLHRTYHQHQAEVNSQKSFESKCKHLALLNCNRQISELLACELIGKVIKTKQIQLKCIVVNRRLNEINLTEYNTIATSNEF